MTASDRFSRGRRERAGARSRRSTATAAISTDPSCIARGANRNRAGSRGDDGCDRADTGLFYLCFSDIRRAGSASPFPSGAQAFERDLTVDPEPYLLRVKTEPHAIAQSLTPQTIFTIDAFDINAVPLKMSVDLAILDDTILQLQPTATTIQTAGPLDTASTTVEVFAVNDRARTQLKATPLLLSTPYCLSDIVKTVARRRRRHLEAQTERPDDRTKSNGSSERSLAESARHRILAGWPRARKRWAFRVLSALAVASCGTTGRRSRAGRTRTAGTAGSQQFGPPQQDQREKR